MIARSGGVLSPWLAVDASYTPHMIVASGVRRLGFSAAAAAIALAGCSSAGGSSTATTDPVVSTRAGDTTTAAAATTTSAPLAVAGARMSAETATAVDDCIVGLSSYAMGNYSVTYSNTRSYLEPGIEKCDHALALLTADGLGAPGSLWTAISQRNVETQAFMEKIAAGSASDADGANYDDASAGFYDRANALANEVR
jgi:hypothetical protein